MHVLRCYGCVCCIGSKVRPRTFGCVAMGSALLCIFRSRTACELFCLDLV